AERDTERAAFACIEFMHAAAHAGRHPPLRDRARIDKCPVDSRARGAHVTRNPGRIHGTSLWPAPWSLVTPVPRQPHLGGEGSPGLFCFAMNRLTVGAWIPRNPFLVSPRHRSW